MKKNLGIGVIGLGRLGYQHTMNITRTMGAQLVAVSDPFPAALERGFRHSLLVLAAWEDGELAGLIRAVGDGATIVFIQDILVAPERQRHGIGTALLRAVLERFNGVRQIELTTDDTPETAAFYRSLGFADFAGLGCRGFMLD